MASGCGDIGDVHDHEKAWSNSQLPSQPGSFAGVSGHGPVSRTVLAAIALRLCFETKRRAG